MRITSPQEESGPRPLAPPKASYTHRTRRLTHLFAPLHGESVLYSSPFTTQFLLWGQRHPTPGSFAVALGLSNGPSNALDAMTIGIAADFATYAHLGLCRRYTGEPYITHPVAVARAVRGVYPATEAICAALLHDTVEDNAAVQIADIADPRLGLGSRIANLVSDLTDVSRTPEDGNRAARKTLDRAHTATADPVAKLVKLADLEHNTASIVEHGHKFAHVYLGEKRLLMDEALVLDDAESMDPAFHKAFELLRARVLATLEQHEEALGLSASSPEPG